MSPRKDLLITLYIILDTISLVRKIPRFQPLPHLAAPHLDSKGKTSADHSFRPHPEGQPALQARAAPECDVWSRRARGELWKVRWRASSFSTSSATFFALNRIVICWHRLEYQWCLLSSCQQIHMFLQVQRVQRFRLPPRPPSTVCSAACRRSSACTAAASNSRHRDGRVG